MITEPVSIPLNTSTYTEIEIPYSDFIRPVSYFTDDATAFKEAIDSTGTGEAEIPEQTKVNLRVFIPKGDPVLLWAKATAGTPNLVVKIGLPER